MKLEMKGTPQCSTHTILTGNFICNASEKQCFLSKQSFLEKKLFFSNDKIQWHRIGTVQENEVRSYTSVDHKSTPVSYNM